MFKVLTKGCEPTKESKYSACIDLYASEDVVIGAGETKLVGLGVAIDLNFLKERIDLYNMQKFGAEDENDFAYYFKKFLKEHYLQLMLRSSLAKSGLIIPNGVDVIDLDYKDEIKIAIHNPIGDLSLYDEVSGEAIYFMDKAPYNIKKGDKIAQITLLEHKSYLFEIENKSN